MRKRPSARQEELSGVLLRGLRDALRAAPMKDSARKRLLAMGYIETVRDRYSKITPQGLAALRRLTP